jgi:ABC-type lipoprotein release transport system permease subunit
VGPGYLISLRRQRNLLDFALGSLWRARWKNGGIVVVFSLVIFIIASFRLMVAGLEQASTAVLATVPDITVQRLVAGRQMPVPLWWVEESGAVFGIRSIKPRVWGYYFHETSGANFTIIGVEDFPGGEPLPGVAMQAVSADEQVEENQFSPMVLGQAVHQMLALGDRVNVSLFRPDLTLKGFSVVGLFAPQTGLVTDDLMVMAIDDARDLFALAPHNATDLLISVPNPLEVDTIAQKLMAKLPGSRVITKAQIGKTYNAAFGWRSGFGMICLIGTVAAFVILAWDKAAGLSPEQRREVALLKTLGWQTGDVMAIRFMESLVVCVVAFLVGTGLAWAHIVFTDGFLFKPLLLGWSVLRPSLSPVPVIRFDDVLIIFVMSVVPYLAATIVPAWRGAMIRADATL